MTNQESYFTGIPGYQDHFVRDGKVVVNNGEHLEDTEPLAPGEISPELAVAVGSLMRVHQDLNHVNLIEEPAGEHSL